MTGAVSQNGWPLITTKDLAARTAALPAVTGRVRLGDVYTVLAYVADQFDKRVEPIRRKASWGWAYRAIRGATKWSNHASATAIDLNADRHPLGKHGTFNDAQVLAIHHILAEVDHVVRWGGDYWPARPDEMHFEINLQPKGSATRVKAAAAKIRAKQADPVKPAPADTGWVYPVLVKGAKGSLVKVLQRALLTKHPLIVTKTARRYGGRFSVDGDFGKLTRAVVVEVQKHARLTVDGRATEQLWQHLGLAAKVRKPKGK
jgi:hypothetical protein